MKSVDQVLKEIEAGKWEPVYILIGAEKFYHDQIIHLLSQKMFADQGSRDLNEVVLYGTENTLAEVLSQATSYPMLADKKLVIVREFEKMKIQDAEFFNQYLKKPAPFSVLLLSIGEVPKNKFFQSLSRLPAAVDCKPVPESRMPQWLMQYARQLGYPMEADAAHFLIANVGPSILMLKNELEKLINFKGEPAAITIDDVQNTSGMYREANVFTLQKALSRRQLAKSIEISHLLLESGADETMINAVLFAFFRKLLIVATLRRQKLSPAQIKQKLHLYDFQLRDFMDALRFFNFEQVKKVIVLLHRFDLGQKGIQAENRDNLEVLCYKICRS